MTQPLSPLQRPGLGISGWQGPLQALRPFSPSLRHESCSCLVQRRAKPRAWMRTFVWAFLYCASVSSFGPLDMRALLARIPHSCEKGFRPGQQYHKLPCTEKGGEEEPDPGTRLVLGSALKLLMAETWAWSSLSCLLLPSL